MLRIVTENEKETYNLGYELAGQLKGSEFLALCGDLGAGKTKFLQGLAHGLGVKGRVNSPTFNILKIYKANSVQEIKTFCHIDTYRLHSEKDLLSLGIDELMEDHRTVIAVEWAEKIKKIWPKKTIVIRIKHLAENKREIIIQ